jgi:hypothetical protein
MFRLLDVHNCYIQICGNNEDIKDYEESLLQKCFDNQQEDLGHTEYRAYEPPFCIQNQKI